MVNSEELVGTTEHLTLYMRCRINRCRYKRVRLYCPVQCALLKKPYINMVRTNVFGSILSVTMFNLLKPTGYMTHHQFNIRQLYALPTLYLCVLYLSENKQRLVPLTA